LLAQAFTLQEYESVLVADTVSQFTFFSVRNYEGKIFLHWNVKDQHKDGIYVICRSTDDELYEIVGYKDGIGIQPSMEIAYYFTDQCNCEGTVFYKIFHVSLDSCLLKSQSLNVVNKIGGALSRL